MSELPPLPEPTMEDVPGELWGQNIIHPELFTAEQMQAYAHAAVAALSKPEPVPRRWIVAKQVAADTGGKRPELAYQIFESVPAFDSFEDCCAAIAEAGLSLGWVAIEADRLNLTPKLSATPPAQPEPVLEQAARMLRKYHRLCVEVGRGDSYWLGEILATEAALRATPAQAGDAGEPSDGEREALARARILLCNTPLLTPAEAVAKLTATPTTEPSDKERQTFAQWFDSLTTEDRYSFDSEGRGFKKDHGTMMHMAWDAAIRATKGGKP